MLRLEEELSRLDAGRESASGGQGRRRRAEKRSQDRGTGWKSAAESSERAGRVSGLLCGAAVESVLPSAIEPPTIVNAAPSSSPERPPSLSDSAFGSLPSHTDDDSLSSQANTPVARGHRQPPHDQPDSRNEPTSPPFVESGEDTVPRSPSRAILRDDRAFTESLRLTTTQVYAQLLSQPRNTPRPSPSLRHKASSREQHAPLAQWSLESTAIPFQHDHGHGHVVTRRSTAQPILVKNLPVQEISCEMREIESIRYAEPVMVSMEVEDEEEKEEEEEEEEEEGGGFIFRDGDTSSSGTITDSDEDWLDYERECERQRSYPPSIPTVPYHRHRTRHGTPTIPPHSDISVTHRETMPPLPLPPPPWIPITGELCDRAGTWERTPNSKHKNRRERVHTTDSEVDERRGPIRVDDSSQATAARRKSPVNVSVAEEHSPSVPDGYWGTRFYQENLTPQSSPSVPRRYTPSPAPPHRQLLRESTSQRGPTASRSHYTRGDQAQAKLGDGGRGRGKTEEEEEEECGVSFERNTSLLHRLRRRKHGSFRYAAPRRRSNSAIKRSLSERMAHRRTNTWADNEEDLQPISGPTYPRSIGRMVATLAGKIHVVELHRPISGKYGIFITEGLDGGVIVSRFADSMAQKFYSGLLSAGDELVAVNGEMVRERSVDYVYNLLAKLDTVVFTVMPIGSRPDW